jgi:hypothetical protein
MPPDDPKAVIRRWVEAWNTQDLDAAEELACSSSSVPSQGQADSY